MPIQSYTSLQRMTGLCKTKVPPEIMDAIELVKEDEQKVKDLGVSIAVDMCKTLISKFQVWGLHFYTLNLEVSVMRIVDALQLVDSHLSTRGLPWRQVEGIEGCRKAEMVRPIFWSNRPKSYIHRTLGWDEFPNGRWGDKDSPAFGDPFFSICVDPDERSRTHRVSMWGSSLSSMECIQRVFCAYLRGKVSRLPWCSDLLGEETSLVQKPLLKLNMLGVLTINSQPRVNGALSNDPHFGWGPKNGVVYQKAYVEFFCSPETFKKIEKGISECPDFTYAAVTASGTFLSNQPDQAITAVTWGVFPGEEIVQPTVVDNESFRAWKDEAFALWLVEWGAIYDKDSESYALLKEIHDRWYLVNVVDNNFLSGDLFTKLVEFVSRK
eukprot:GHVT01088088.1.p1 GENE.GHVT01088088.1~~GHVT01088088.1.p1  ORF type:complete len:381 (-),score=18.56 GHVT01088088.1:922-2064(-)